jgi:3-dehydroquinate synthase
MTIFNPDENEVELSLTRFVDDSYSIRIGENLFPEIAKYISEKFPKKKPAIITDSNVAPIYGPPLIKELNLAGIHPMMFIIPAGEENKQLSECTSLIRGMHDLKYNRDSVIIALGGGMVGDSAGLIASIFNRGVPYIQVPTTLLAQADAAIGGKTAVDTEFGKNLIGAFKQPKKVFMDLSTLSTLRDEDFNQGLAETIKHGVIYDRLFFDYLEDKIDLIKSRDKNDLFYLARKNSEIKGTVVERDMEELALRQILNYGHTIGHAIEKLANYKILHGHCVSMGMVVAGKIANAVTGFSLEDLARQDSLLERAGLMTKIPHSIFNEQIIEVTTRDKKARNGKAMYVLPKSLGQMDSFEGTYSTLVDKEIVERALNESR